MIKDARTEIAGQRFRALVRHHKHTATVELRGKDDPYHVYATIHVDQDVRFPNPDKIAEGLGL